MSAIRTEVERKNGISMEKDQSVLTSQKHDGLKNRMKENSSVIHCKQIDLVQDENENEVEVVVSKAKRAATFLWALLHAQLCKSEKCRHLGCLESKHLLLHINACSATYEYSCPTSHPGCQQARKLLSHYRKCKDLRIKQRRQARQQQVEQTNLCLICTLLARHDKTISNSLCLSAPTITTTQKKKAEQSHTLTTSFDKIYSPQITRRKTSSKSVQFDLHQESKTESPLNMPPPPPRPRTNSIESLPTLQQTASILRALPFSGIESNRPRAGSLDEKKRLKGDVGNDPTVEFQLHNGSDQSFVLNRVERQLPFRKRSVSCSVLPCERNSGDVCKTIMEE